MSTSTNVSTMQNTEITSIRDAAARLWELQQAEHDAKARVKEIQTEIFRLGNKINSLRCKEEIQERQMIVILPGDTALLVESHPAKGASVTEIKRV